MKQMIVAMTKDGVIGNKGNNKLLWHIPSELAFFKEQTLGKNCVFGYNTYMSLPFKPLKGRNSIVLCNNIDELHIDNVDIMKTIEELNNKYSDYIVCGGGSIYDAMIDLVDEIIISFVDVEAKGNLLFPLARLEGYKKEKIYSNDDFTSYRYTKNGGI